MIVAHNVQTLCCWGDCRTKK